MNDNIYIERLDNIVEVFSSQEITIEDLEGYSGLDEDIIIEQITKKITEDLFKEILEQGYVRYDWYNNEQRNTRTVRASLRLERIL